MNARPRRRIPTWGWLLAGIAAAWLVVTLVVGSMLEAPTTTGDPLLDYYLAHADPEGVIPEELFPDLEQQFADNPRLWDIYSISGAGEAKGYDDYFGTAKSKYWPLSPAILDSYIFWKEREWGNGQEESEVRQGQLTKDERLRRSVERLRRSSAVIDRKHAAERDELYAKLAAAAPEVSWTWYRQALLHFQRDDYELAIASLNKGNAAELNHSHEYFPIVQYHHDLRHGGPLAAHPRAWVIANPAQLAQPDMVRIKRMHNWLFSEALSKRDADALLALHIFACRIGKMENGKAIAPLVAVTLLKHEVGELGAAKLEERVNGAVSELGSKADKVKQLAKSLYSNSPAEQWINNGPSPRQLISMQLGKFHQNEIMHEDHLWLHQHYSEQIIPLLEEIEQFDFAALLE